jgi:hypothetical protein
MPSGGMHTAFHFLVLAGIGAVAAALVFLSMQVRNNIRAIQHNANITLRGQFLQIQMAIAGDETLARIYERGLKGLQGLSASEQIQFFMIASSVFTYWNEVYSEAKRGLVPIEAWNDIERVLRDFARLPGTREYWAYRKHWYSEDLQSLVDRMMADPDGAQTIYPEPVG